MSGHKRPKRGPTPTWSETPHPVGGILRWPISRADLIGRTAGEDLRKHDLLAIGEDGKVYAWHEPEPKKL